MPKTFSAFQKIKSNGGEKWKRLQSEYRGLTNSRKSGIIKASKGDGENELLRKSKSEKIEPMQKKLFQKIKKSYERNGGVIFSSEEIDNHLASQGAVAATLNENIILLKSNTTPSASTLFEELIHTAQYKSGKATGDNWIEMEIEAKEKLIKFQKQYNISDKENSETLKQLKSLKKLKGA
jgi:hypothetical protein